MTIQGVHLRPSHTTGSENEIHQSKSAAFWLRQEGLFLHVSCFAIPVSVHINSIDYTQALLNGITQNIYNHLVNSTLEYFCDKQLLFRGYSPKSGHISTYFPTLTLMS